MATSGFASPSTWLSTAWSPEQPDSNPCLPGRELAHELKDGWDAADARLDNAGIQRSTSRSGPCPSYGQVHRGQSNAAASHCARAGHTTTRWKRHEEFTEIGDLLRKDPAPGAVRFERYASCGSAEPPPARPRVFVLASKPRAQGLGTMRTDVSSRDVLLAVCGIGKITVAGSDTDEGRWRRLITVTLDGLHRGPEPSARRRADGPDARIVIGETSRAQVTPSRHGGRNGDFRCGSLTGSRSLLLSLQSRCKPLVATILGSGA